MSKKFSFIFSILVFAILFSFIGCTDLLAPKAQTDINLNIDLSKIIKSSRNEGGSQGASSLGDNPTIKVAIYDAKNYDKATNSTENLTLITQSQASIGGDGIARVKLSDIPVGIDAIVFAELSFTDEHSTQVVYAGNSGVFKVKASDNKVSLVLMKVGNSEIYPDDTNTPYENYTLYKKTENGEEEEVSNNTEASISTSSTMETNVTINPDSSDSVWTYFVKPINNTRFTEDGNYKVSVELKTKSDATTVVGIAAARADYFFTVNDTWTPCEFETGYVKGSTDHDFTIGLGLSSEIQIKNLKIEKLSEIDTTEPSLVFDISRHAIETYLGKDDRPEKIIDVSTNGSYNITINTPMCHSTGTDDSYIQDVKLHLRSYATETTGANRVSFKVDNLGANTFYTSVMADTANEKSTAWNNNATKISDNNDGNFSVDFPNYKANDELIVDLITSSTSTSQDNSTSFTLSNFKVEKAGDSPFSGKIFAIKTGETWTQGKSVEVTIPKDNNKEFDVGLFNGFNDEEGTPSDLDDVTRFLYTGNADITDDLSYSVNNTNPNEPKFIITNDSNEEKTVKIKLNENYEVVIEEVSSIVTTWADLKYRIDNTSISEIVITDDLTATEEITISAPVKLIANNDVKITRGGIFTGNFFKVSSGSSLELAGSDNSTITLDGGHSDNISADSPLITVNGKLTLSNCTLQNNNSSGYGGAVYVDGGTLNFSSGTIQNCIAGDAGAVYLTNGGSFQMTGGTIQNCKATRYEGGGVYVTGANSNFKMMGTASISRCSAGMYGGGVSYGCGTSADYNFTMEGDASITSCSATGNGGGVYLYGYLVMNGGIISGNEASNGDGVYVRNDNNVLSSLSMSGNALVNSNNDVVYLASGTTVTVSGELNPPDDANGIVATITPSEYTVGKQILSADGVDLAQQVDKFTLSNEDFVIGSDGKIASAINYAQGLTCDVDSDGTVTLYISSAEGLAIFRNIVNGSFESDIFVVNDSNQNSNHKFTANTPSPSVNGTLRDSITIYDEWTPIGKYANDNTKKPYSGTFDGDRKTVTFNNITHSDTSMYSSGLFQMVSGTVKNLVIDGYISRTETGYIGGVVGYLDGGTIENCVNKAKISNVAANGTGGIVGVIGNTGSSLVGCVNMGYISSENSSVGGIVGGSTGTASNISISKCINVGEISGAYTVAGIYGNLSSNQSGFTLSDCINLGNIYMTGPSSSTVYMAGIINNTPSCTVSNCLSVGLLQNNGSSFSVTIGAISSTPTPYTNCYFNNEIISSPTDQGTPGNNPKTTQDLCSLTISNLTNWSCENSRYPLPDIETNLPTEIWNELKQKATPVENTYSIGDVYYKDNEPVGIVFESTSTYIKILALEEEYLTYGTDSCKNYISSYYPEFTNTVEGSTNLTNWYSFVSSMCSYFSPADFPAFSYCVTYRDDEGEAGTWYLPSSNEIQTIQTNKTTINNSLNSISATNIGTSYSYWSSTYTSSGKAKYIRMNSGSISESSISTSYYVRPCKKILLANNDSEVLVTGVTSNTACNMISNITSEGEHYIKLDSSVTINDLGEDIWNEINTNDLLDSISIYLDLSATNITELSAQTFYRLKGLTSVSLPSTLSTIDASSFQGCVNLKNFVIANNSNFTLEKDSDNNAAILFNSNKTKLISYPSASGSYSIPESVTELAEYAFGDATNLESVTIPRSLTTIPSTAFYGALYLKTFVLKNNSNFALAGDGQILLSSDTKTLICWPYACEEITIPDSVAKIEDYALAETVITSVDLNNVEEIGKYAFYNCTDLESVNFAGTNWSVVDSAGTKTPIDVTNFNVNNLIYASDDEAAKGYADYTWEKDSSSTSGGGIANYTDIDGISISNYQYPKTSLVTVNSENVTVNCSDEANGVFYFYGNVTISPFAMGHSMK